jgi:hypothetical protein
MTASGTAPKTAATLRAGTHENAEVVEAKKTEEERPPQQAELLCTICHMPSCWR